MNLRNMHFLVLCSIIVLLLLLLLLLLLRFEQSRIKFSKEETFNMIAFGWFVGS